jgi:hypothetical protein
MHQALLRPDIANLDEAGNAFELDLSTVPEFNNPALYAPGGRLHPPPPGRTPGKFIHPSLSIDADSDLHRFMVNEFNTQRINSGRSAITDRYFLFCFGVNAGYAGLADAPSTIITVDVMQANAAIAPDDWTLGKEEKSV